MESPWKAVHAAGKEMKFWSLNWAKKRIEKMGPGYAIYYINGWYYIGLDGNYRSKV